MWVTELSNKIFENDSLQRISSWLYIFSRSFERSVIKFEEPAFI